MSDAAAHDGEFPARIKRLRTALGLTRKEVVDKADGAFAVRTLDNWENGRTEPTLGPKFRALVAALGTTIPYALWGEESDDG
jgi:transcriptional regulator with XRE-family HTH domain